MKKIFYSAMMAVSVAFSATKAMAEELKLGSIDMKVVVDGYFKTKALNKQISKEEIAIQNENQGRVEEIQELIKEIQKIRLQLKDASLPGGAREKLNKRGQKLHDEYMQKETRRKEDLKVKGQALGLHRDAEADKILKEISEVVQEYSVRNGYDFVFNKIGKGASVANVVFTKQKFDITPQIVELLNKKAPKEEGATPAPAPVNPAEK